MSTTALTPHVEEDKTTWRDHPNIAGIRVSDTGRVQSRRRSARGGLRGGGSVSVLGDTWRELRPWKDSKGYGYIGVRRPGRKTSQHFLVHRLVLEAFVGPCPDGMEALHRDGNAHNNHLDNLRWGTHAENVADTVRHGTIPRGSKHYAAKLTDEQVVAILSLLAARKTPREIAPQFGVCRQLVEFIRDGKRWTHITRPEAT